MCGIIGYIGPKPCLDILYTGLEKLEYRGYDSAGIATVFDGKLQMAKAVGKLAQLKPLLTEMPKESTIGLGHTRWATHGTPSYDNAHPHEKEGLVLVHNGIIENYKEIKLKLLEDGACFRSETDSEVIVHLLDVPEERGLSLFERILRLIPKLEGAYALGILDSNKPEGFYIVKQGSPLVIGEGEGENFFASDALALVNHTKKFYFLEDAEIAYLTKSGVEFWNFSGERITKTPTVLDVKEDAASKGHYHHYMLKEIYEQSAVISQSIGHNFSDETASSLARIIANLDLDRMQKIHIVGCGTSYYAGLMGKYMLEPMIKRPVEVELASEFRYRDPYLDKNTLLIAMTQSGETADTLACVKHAKKVGCQVMSICNVEHASIPRSSDVFLNMKAGAEIGVASTKAFTSMVLNLYFFTLAVAKKTRDFEPSFWQAKYRSLKKFVYAVEQALALDSAVAEVAKSYFQERHFLFLGRGLSYPIACEGALKLKEISYIHAEGYAGGELKHGPIALIDRYMPILAIVPHDGQHSKMLSNVEELKAREGRILGIGSKDDLRLKALCENYIACPQVDDPVLQSVLSVIPLQLFAYHMALLRDTDVDQPRNLAKSVTVE